VPRTSARYHPEVVACARRQGEGRKADAICIELYLGHGRRGLEFASLFLLLLHDGGFHRVIEAEIVGLPKLNDIALTEAAGILQQLPIDIAELCNRVEGNDLRELASLVVQLHVELDNGMLGLRAIPSEHNVLRRHIALRTILAAKASYPFLRTSPSPGSVPPDSACRARCGKGVCGSP
jgi:hypothetical protein